ncbi:MAG: diaminopimelate epimerase [Betaproteobacteria bacterium RIFCSPLOWO2_12_FULL_63_13]|nr:MAG: diaminopimelate epimerase [Betaproteobacteria bacterium RIFCSPLOWO2_12_FULL_63_13]
MKLAFTKMQGAGNDFVVFDGIGQKVELTPGRVRQIANRYFGIGCDQVLLVERPQSADTDFRYRIWNADGIEVGQCGNGARCFVRFVRDRGLTAKDEIRVETLSGVITPRLERDGTVSVNMGPPVFEPERVPFVSDSAAVVQTLEGVDGGVQITALSMGNPHAVQVVDDVDAAPVLTQGPTIEHHPRFPQRANAGYMQVVDRSRIRLRVWERGAGETLCCGTGACAAVVTGVRRGLLDPVVDVETRGGRLTIRWDGAENDLNCAVWMSGPAVAVFEGEIQID